jgi:hypothetical protein
VLGRADDYEYLDGGTNESTPVVNTAHVRENGSIAIHAPLTLGDRLIGLRTTPLSAAQ